MLYQDQLNNNFNEILDYFGFNDQSPIKLMNTDDFYEDDSIIQDTSSKKDPEINYKRKLRFNFNKSNSDKKDINTILSNSVFNKANPELFYQLLKFHNSSMDNSNKINTYVNILPNNPSLLNLKFNGDINAQFNYTPYENPKRIEYIDSSGLNDLKFNVNPCCIIDIDSFNYKNNIIENEIKTETEYLV